MLRRSYNRFVFAASTLFYPVLLKRLSPGVELVHSHFAPVGWHFLPTAAKFQVPHVVSFYGLDYEWLPHVAPVWHKRYQELFRRASLFICEGPHGASVLGAQGCPPEKIRVSRLGVPAASIVPAGRAKRSGELKLIQVASFTEKKGHMFALEAFLLALEDCPAMTLTFVGSNKPGERSDIERSLRERVNAANVDDRVFFIPKVPYPELHNLLRDYQVFIHPSVYAANRDSEGGAPIVLLDAQATGMPVIATEHCDIPDEVIHGSTGLLAAGRDVEGLAAHVRQFCQTDQADYDTFALAARAHVEARYDVARNALSLRRIYDEALSV